MDETTMVHNSSQDSNSVPINVKKEKKITLESVSRVILLVSIFFLPMLFIPSAKYSIVNMKLGLFILPTLLVLLFWSILSLKKDTFKFPTNLISLSIVTLLLSTLVSSIFSASPAVSIFGINLSMITFMGTLILFIFSFLIFSLFYSKENLTLMNLAIYFSTLITVVFHLAYILLDKLFTLPTFGFFLTNSINTVGKWTDLGVMAALLILLSFLMIESAKQGWLRIASWVGLISGAITVVIVNSVNIWVILGILSIIYLVYKVVISKGESKNSINKNIPVTPIVVILVSFVMILSGNIISVFTNDLLQINFEETKPSASATLEITRQVFSESPILGVGPNRFEYAWQKHKPFSVNLSNFWGVDFSLGYSYFMTIPAVTGIVGTLAFLFFIVLVVWNAFKLLFKKSESGIIEKRNALPVFGLLFFIIVLALRVPSVTIIVYAFVFFGIFLSSLSKAGLFKESEITIESKPKLGFVYIFSVIVLMIASIYLIYTTSRQFSSRILIEQADRYTAEGDIVKAERTLLNAINIYPTDFNYRALAQFYKLQIADLLNNGDSNNESTVERFRSLLSSSITASRNAINFDNTNYLNYVSLADTYQQLIGLGVQGSYAQAKLEFENALSRNHKNPGIYLSIARSAYFAGENEEAKEYIGKAIETKPNFADAAFLLSQIQAKEGNIQDAISSVDAATRVDPTNSNLFFQLGLLKYNQDDWSGSVAAFERSVILRPVFSNAKYFLGLSYERLGRTEDAIKQFEEIKLLNPGNQEVEFILSNLKSGQSPFQDAQPPIDVEPEDRDELPLDETGDEEVLEKIEENDGGES